MAEDFSPKPEENGAEAQAPSAEPPRQKDIVDRFFDNFAGVPIKVVDTVIIVSIIALVAVIAIGILTARL